MAMITAEVLKATRPATYPNAPGLITLQIEVPLYVWTEILTHRRFARNASSARAMSTDRYVDMGYYTPEVFHKKASGMKSSDEPIKHQWLAALIWHTTTKLTHIAAKALEYLSNAKEERNRLISPNKMIRGIVTGTEDAWKAFLHLRNSPEADKAMQIFAKLVHQRIQDLDKPLPIIRASGEPYIIPTSGPSTSGVILGRLVGTTVSGVVLDRVANVGDTEKLRTGWEYSDTHSPYGLSEVLTVANCARVSFARTSGKDDQALHDALLRDGHLSPFEHMAYFMKYPMHNVFTTVPLTDTLDYMGWETYRSRIENPDHSEEA